MVINVSAFMTNNLEWLFFTEPRKKFEETDQFLETYNGLNTLERRTGRQMDSAMLEVTGRSKSVDQVRSQREVDRRGESYVPRGQKFNHLLDTAYQEILVKKTKDTSRGQSRASHALYESFRPMDLMSGTGMKILLHIYISFWKDIISFPFQLVMTILMKKHWKEN